ncbi:MAG TPA: hypothetical protein DCQ32_03025 [Cyanobacteria bacterium UBA8156]|jgi:hypothetical protein|nr:hypothetical protein [Cyanobacteria bacterium UBA8156]
MKKSLTVFPNTLAFWLPLALWSATGVLVGRHLYDLVLTGDRWGAIGCLVVAMGGVGAVPQALAGLPAALVALLRLWPMNWQGLLGGAIAGSVMVFLTLPESDRVREPEQKLTPAELVAVGWTLALAWQWSGSVLMYLPQAIAPWALGGFAGGVVGIGPQLRSAGLSRKEVWQLLAAATALPMGLGALWGALAFRPPTNWL